MNKDYDKAKTLFLAVISRLFEQGSYDDDLNILHINLKISKIFEAQKDYE